MAELVLLNEKIDLNTGTENLAAFAGELNLSILDSDHQTASWIIQNIDAMNDEEWEAMTAPLKEWSNHIQQEKIRVAELEKKEAIVEKTKKTKAENSTDSGFPTTPAAIAKAINDCKTKADISAQVTGIAKALGMESAPKMTKSWTIAKQKEAAIAGLKKPKASKAAPAASAPAKTPKAGPASPASPAGPAAPGTPEEGEADKVQRAKKTAKATAASAASPKQQMVEGEPFRRGTTAHAIWTIFKNSKAQAGISIADAKEKFSAYLAKNPDVKCANPDSRVTRTIAALKSGGLLTRVETGNYILNENMK